MDRAVDNLELEGFAYAAQSSRRLPSRLLARNGVNGIWVDVLDDKRKVIGTAQLSDIHVDPPLGRAPRKLALPDGTVFETDDHTGMERLTGKTRGGLLHQYEKFRPRLIAVVAVCLAATWVLWRYGLDIMASVAIAFTPPVIVQQMDTGTLRTIDFAMAEPSRLNDDQKADVTRIYEQLVTTLPQDIQDKHNFDLLFRNMPGMGPNAFALPGGTMVMTDDFVKQFPNPDILAGVLGHEIGHVVDQHGLKRIYRSLSLYLLIAFLAGDTGPILEDIVLEGNVLLSLSFSRTQESEADEFGLTLSNDAGFNPTGLRQFFEKMDQKFGGREPAQWMSTHPNSAARVKAIDAFIDDL